MNLQNAQELYFFCGSAGNETYIYRNGVAWWYSQEISPKRSDYAKSYSILKMILTPGRTFWKFVDILHVLLYKSLCKFFEMHQTFRDFPDMGGEIFFAKYFLDEYFDFFDIFLNALELCGE